MRKGTFRKVTETHPRLYLFIYKWLWPEFSARSELSHSCLHTINIKYGGLLFLPTQHLRMAHLVFGEPSFPHSMWTCWECILRLVTPEGEPLTNLFSSDSLRDLNLGYCDEWWMTSVGVQSQHQKEPNVRLSMSLLPLEASSMKAKAWKTPHAPVPSACRTVPGTQWRLSKHRSMNEWIHWTAAFHILPLAWEFSLSFRLCELIAIFSVTSFCYANLSCLQVKNPIWFLLFPQNGYMCRNSWGHSLMESFFL